MRTINIALLTVVVVVLVSASSAFAVIADSDIAYLDFTGWDESLISGGGQTFVGLAAGSLGPIDVTVNEIAAGGGNLASSASGQVISIGRIAPGSHSYRFVFSKSLPLIFNYQTTDANEDVSLFTSDVETNMQIAGAPVTVTLPAGGIRVDGNGFGFDPSTGSAFGQLTALGGSSLATYRYGSDANFTKYDFFRVGVLIPEPNTSALAGIGLLGMVMSFRRRQK